MQAEQGIFGWLVGLVRLVRWKRCIVCNTQIGAEVVVRFSKAENQNPTNPTTIEHA